MLTVSGDSLHYQVLLATAVVQVDTLQGKSLSARVLIDQGSELSFMKYSLFKRLGLTLHPDALTLRGIGNVSAGHPLGVGDVKIRSIHSSTSLNVVVHVLPSLTVDLPSFAMTDPKWPHLQGLALADPEFLHSRPVDIILGASPASNIMCADVIRGPLGTPIAQLTTLGWIVYGSVTACSPNTVGHSLHVSTDTSLQDAIARFWEQEEIPSGNSTLNTLDTDECELHFRQTHYRNADGRYVVRLPLKAPESQLGDSLVTAISSLKRLTSRFAKDKEYADLYRNFMEEYIQLGHMKRVSLNDLPANACFVPHHGVLKKDGMTTKLRTVFNGSSPTSSGLSLNDILHAGPKTQIDLLDVTLRIRWFKILFATDVVKMYRQIDVDPLDWALQCILWSDESDLLDAFVLTTVTYGLASSPFDAVRAILQLVKDEGHKYPLAISPMLDTRYVDDIYGGADAEEKAIEIARQTKDLCATGCFPLAKWASNSLSLIQALAPDQTEDSSSRDIGDSPVKVLGLHWNSHQDVFQFKYTLPNDSPKTKRAILSEIARLFDPMGLLAPVVVKAKIFMQELWLDRVSWDTQLSPMLIHRWTVYREDLRCLEDIRIPRWIHTLSDSVVELHGFSDASQHAMAAAVYLRVTNADGTGIVSLLCSKTQVAPLKTMTIPRLELTAAWLLTQLVLYVKNILKLLDVRIHLWTDSAVTLAWIKSPATRWKTFVRNRVSKIQEMLRDVNWRFIPGKLNPADCASRGMSTQKLKDHHLWWYGPHWMQESEESWPSLEPPQEECSHREERSGLVLLTWKQDPDLVGELLNYYSYLCMLLRKLSIWLRVIACFKGVENATLSNPLTPSDLNDAKMLLIKYTQAQYFAHELKIIKDGDCLPRNNCLTKLTPYIDHQGILRVGGRLKHALLDDNEKHPAILPRSSKLTTLLINTAHLKTLHGGTQLTLAELRQSVWIVGGRVPVRSQILRCVVCIKHRGKRAQQLMGQLPAARITPARAFLHSGLDYAGPVTLKTFQGRGAKTYKCWIAVFVCMFSSAVHIEVVTDYSSAAFVAAYRRFVSRRGICHTLYSDCGTNFVGANKELKKLFQAGSRSLREVSELIAQDGTCWKFNPPGAPHFGGKWEAAVKSIKTHLRRIMGDSLLTLDQFTTLLTQIEAILNSRPLAPLTEDPMDLTILTPGHLLIGGPLTAIPEPSLLEVQPSRLSQWQRIQQMVHQFWKVYYASCMHRFQAVSKWHHPRNDIKIGSVALLTDDIVPPTKWPLARVIALHPGDDGLVRVVTLKTKDSELVRPIAKLCLLPFTYEDETLVDAVANAGEDVQSLA